MWLTVIKKKTHSIKIAFKDDPDVEVSKQILWNSCYKIFKAFLKVLAENEHCTNFRIEKYNIWNVLNKLNNILDVTEERVNIL